jgi:hypothetical protein
MSLIPPPPPPPSGYPDVWAALAALSFNKHYLHISFHYPPPMSELEAAHRIQPIINTADDWLKYAGNCWIVWSSQKPQEWFDKFAAVDALKPCSIFIVKIDLSPSPDNRAGQFPKWVWEWIGRTRT